jgi:subtilisin family serine protease
MRLSLRIIPAKRKSPMVSQADCYPLQAMFRPLTLSISRCSSYLNWKSRYREVYEKFIPAQIDHVSIFPVKIAILDTGIDLTHPDMEARIENIKGKYNWLNEKLKGAVHDRNGHGTFTAGLLLDYAPDAQLYIAKIAENKPSSPRIIAEVFSGQDYVTNSGI